MATILVKLLDNASEYYKVTSTGKESGYDLYTSEDVQIQPLKTALVGTGVAIASTDGSCTFLYPRSSIYKSKVMLHNSIGVIDATYTGEVKMVLFNPTNEVVNISKGHKLVQLIRPSGMPFEVKFVDELPKTDRGDKGFGSSGIRN